MSVWYWFGNMTTGKRWDKSGTNVCPISCEILRMMIVFLCKVFRTFCFVISDAKIV